MQKKLKVTTIGGGSGQFTILTSLKTIKNLEISAIVSMTDSGGSTGVLRGELGILPPGDILKCILALSPYDKTTIDFLFKRFQGSQRLKDHSVGNMLLSMLSEYTGSFAQGAKELAQILEVKGNIYPVTTDKASLVAEFVDGTRSYGEESIDMPKTKNIKKIKEIYLVPHHLDKIKAFPKALESIENANYIIIGPGDLYTSILPNLVAGDIANCLKNSKAKIIYISNIMTKANETKKYCLNDFINELQKYIGRSPDIVIYNNKMPSKKTQDRYKMQESETVLCKKKLPNNIDLIKLDLLDIDSMLVRHDITKLKNKLSEILC